MLLPYQQQCITTILAKHFRICFFKNRYFFYGILFTCTLFLSSYIFIYAFYRPTFVNLRLWLLCCIHMGCTSKSNCDFLLSKKSVCLCLCLFDCLFNSFSARLDFTRQKTSDSDVYSYQILTSKAHPRTERIKYL